MAFQNKTFRKYFIVFFVLTTPMFINIALNDINADKMDVIRGFAMALQYLFCIISLPTFLTRQTQ
jgi:hypothetical protein